jgi:hypothetical protein
VSSWLRTAGTTGAIALVNLAAFSIASVAGWSTSPIAGMTAFIVAGMLVACWTRSLPAVVAPAAVVSTGAIVVLAWAQLAADNVGVHTPMKDALPFLIQWPGVGFLALGVFLGAALGAAGWIAGQPLAARLRRRRHQAVE